MGGSSKKLHYGWVIFAVCFLMIFVALGFGSSTKSIFLKAVTADQELGISRTSFSLNDTFRFLATAVSSLFFGAIVEKIGARLLIGGGFLFLISSFVVSSFATSGWHFWVSGALLGVGFSMASTSIVAYVVEKWFTNNKGTIMSVILAANGLGGFASEQIVSRIVRGFDLSIAWSDSHWRLAYRVIAILIAVTGVIVFLLIRNDPKEMGLEPMGQNSPKKKKRGSSWSGYELREIFHKPFFYLSGVCVFLIGFSLHALSGIARAHQSDVGIPEALVVTIFSIYNLLLVAGKILSGLSYDRFGIRFNFGFCCLAALVSVTCMAYLTADRVPLAWIYGLVAGFAMPMETVMIPLLVADLFGQKSYARVLGYYMALNTFGYACGSPVSNLFYDHFQTYRPFFFVLIGILAFATIASQISIAIADRQRVARLSSGRA